MFEAHSDAETVTLLPPIPACANQNVDLAMDEPITKVEPKPGEVKPIMAVLVTMFVLRYFLSIQNRITSCHANHYSGLSQHLSGFQTTSKHTHHKFTPQTLQSNFPY